MTGGNHSRGEDYAKVLCCCGHRIVTMSWDDYRNNTPPLCEHEKPLAASLVSDG